MALGGGRHCGWERAGIAAGAGLTLGARGGGRLMGGMGRGSQLPSRGLQLRLGTPISSAPRSPRIAIPWVQWRAADHR